MNRYKFKSREPFFSKEREGSKNNTVRKINLNEQKFIELLFHMHNQTKGIMIEILNADKLKECKNEYFVREIQDISVYDDLMIITWIHE